MAQCATTKTPVTTAAVVAGSVGLWGWQVSPAIAATVESNSNSNSAESVEDDFITTESGLQYKVVKEGTGAIPLPGQTVKAHYTGWLNGFDDDDDDDDDDSISKKFDPSRDCGRPFTFVVGNDRLFEDGMTSSLPCN
jgi:FKBP-type peptidyl-prolyl cis-trans isomerase